MTLADEIFTDPAEAFTWLDRWRGRKAEIALTLLQIAYYIPSERQDNISNAEDPQQV